MSRHTPADAPLRVICDGCDDDTAGRYVVVLAPLDGRTYPGLLCVRCWRRCLGPTRSASDAEQARLLFAVAIFRQAWGAPPVDVLRRALEPLDGLTNRKD